jgi:hypothetical protein
MLWIIFALLLIVGLVAIFASYTLIGASIQILSVLVLVALGVARIRRYRVD